MPARPAELQSKDHVLFVADLGPVIGAFGIIGELACINPAMRPIILRTTDAISDLIKIVPVPWPRKLAFLLGIDQTEIALGTLVPV